MLDDFAAMLTTSRYAIPAADLGDPAAVDKVASAIKFQNGIIRAQELSLAWRAPANRRDANCHTAGRCGCCATDATSRTRPRSRWWEAGGAWCRDRAATRVLEALLATVLALSVAAWVLGLGARARVLARSPMTIASMAALAAGGNLAEALLGLDTSVAATGTAPEYDDIRRWFGDGAIFQIGWRSCGGEEYFGIWVLGEDGELWCKQAIENSPKRRVKDAGARRQVTG